MTNEQQRSPIFCLDKLKKHLYNTIWGIKQLLMGDMRDWAVDCNGEGCEWVVRDGGDSRVVMMAAAVEDSSGG
jgi:hypothetical protein